jgi:DNA-binding beta-propeller fold protein YncE
MNKFTRNMLVRPTFLSRNRSRIVGLVVLLILIPLAVLGVNKLQQLKGNATYPPVLAGTATGGTNAPTAGSSIIRHYEYVFPDGGMYVYDMDRGHELVKTIRLPTTAGVRGVVASPITHMLYISYGGDGGSNGNGSLLKYDLVADQLVWTKSYSHGIDSMAISPDGKTIYMPDGEITPDGTWYVIDANSGNETGTINGGRGPHNTIVSLNGAHVYLGGRNHNYLEVADTRTNQVIKNIGPLFSGVRPFTINGSETIAYTTSTGLLGFQVSDIKTGQVLYTVHIKGFSWNGRGPSAPSHGISLSPDEKELYVMDSPNSYVHVFDVSGVPASAPVQVADIKVTSMAGNESDCAYDCLKDGWIQHSKDGRFVYVGDSGDVIDTAIRKSVITLPTLSNTRKMLEIDWQNGVPIFTTSRSGLGYITHPGSSTPTSTSNPTISAFPTDTVTPNFIAFQPADISIPTFFSLSASDILATEPCRSVHNIRPG